MGDRCRGAGLHSSLASFALNKEENNMACKNVCRLCPKLILSTAVTYTAPNLVITIPEGAYQNCEKYCIVIAQAIPATTPVDAPVVVQIGTGTELYPLNNCDCSQVTARYIQTRTKYSVRVSTSGATAAFKALGNICCVSKNNRTAINGTAPVAEPAPTPGA